MLHLEIVEDYVIDATLRDVECGGVDHRFV